MGDKYDYSLTVYTTRKNKIKVIYDDSMQLPYNHMVYAPEKLNMPMTDYFKVIRY
jgi:hypothetical protein